MINVYDILQEVYEIVENCQTQDEKIDEEIARKHDAALSKILALADKVLNP